MAYIVPQVLVFQEFQLIPGAITQPLRACIVGPVYNPLIRYTDTDERSRGYLEEYDPNLVPPNDASGYKEFLWPERGGGKVDHSFTKVTFENALLKYAEFTTTSHPGTRATFHSIDPAIQGGYKNRVRAENIIFAGLDSNGRDTTHANYGLPDAASGLPRDVQPGDIVQLVGSVVEEGEPVLYTYESYVTGTIADREAATVDNARADDLVNQETVGSTTVDFEANPVVGEINQVSLGDVDASSYDGMVDGNIEETYTLEVTRSGAPSVAELRLFSASGNDDQAAISSITFGAPKAVGSRGLTVTFELNSSNPGDSEEFVAGQRWEITVHQAFTATTVTIPNTADYSGDTDTTYVVEVVRGGYFADDDARPQINVYTTTGVDIRGPTTLSTGTAVAIGNFDTQLSFSGTYLRKGDKFYVDVTAEADGEIHTLVLAHRLPDALLGEASESENGFDLVPELTLTLLVKRTLDIPQNRVSAPGIRNWEGFELEIGIRDNITAYVDDIRVPATGARKELPVMEGSMYVTYRAVSQANLRTVNTISDVSEITEQIGVLHPDQPMAVAVEKALSNSNGTPVKFLPISDNTKEAYADSLEILTGTDEVYGLVPLTFDREVQNVFSAHVNTMSSPENGRWRITFVSTPARTDKALLVEDTESAPILATLGEDPASETEENTLVEILTPEGQEPVDLQSAGIVSGDVLRCSYIGDGFGNTTFEEYVIDSVISNDTVRIVSPGRSVPISQASKVEFWRRLTTTEIAQDVGVLAGSFFSRRVYNVWPDYISAAGVEYPGYVLAAAIAGQASGVVPQQGHTNLELLGFDSVTRTTEMFNRTQLNILAGAGVYIVTQDPQTGKVYTRHELSTNTTDVNTRELMVTKNVDAMSYVYLKTLAPFIGISNITPTLIDQIDAEIQATTTYLKTNGYVARLGSQLIDGVLTKIEQHPTLKDRLVAVLEITIPYPLNNLELHLVIPA